MNPDTRMRLTARYVGLVTILAPDGELTVPTAHVFLREARRVLDLTTESLIAVDFTAVRRIDSSGYAALVALLRHVQRRAGEVCLIGLNHEARLLLEIMQLHLLFDVREDVSSAVHALTARPARETPVLPTLHFRQRAWGAQRRRASGSA